MKCRSKRLKKHKHVVSGSHERIVMVDCGEATKLVLKARTLVLTGGTVWAEPGFRAKRPWADVLTLFLADAEAVHDLVLQVRRDAGAAAVPARILAGTAASLCILVVLNRFDGRATISNLGMRVQHAPIVIGYRRLHVPTSRSGTDVVPSRQDIDEGSI